ncbi:hypothetical protein QA584_26640 [Anaerocolumna sp. AGMB13025]|uniref:hypothetical protein n=1 Tax=Anaerocolumna sp. AGMB13025 TaxID=3039116 RepID=UPI00241EAF42|nr:hypothetical protein [Anaerocolumna sp. AGMB13025]WFR57145.1 hypothetical protein QA584_26640 [Anaerocolumna sp. AGMB13025]
MVYEEDGKVYYERLNDFIKSSRDWFVNVGSSKPVRNKNNISEKVAADLLNCDKYVIKIYTKYGLLHADCIDGKHYFTYEWIEDFAKDNRLLDESGNLPSETGYDSKYYTDNQGRLIVTPKIIWIDKNNMETDKPNPESPPVKYAQTICVHGKKHRHSMGVGGRAEGYYLMPLPEDIKLIKKYNLNLGEQYKDLYCDN